MISHLQLLCQAFNSLFKRFYFTRTQRGGAVSNGGGQSTRLEPIAKWLQRRLVFMAGHDLEFIRERTATMTEAEKESFRSLVKDHGGTYEHCMPIGKTGDETWVDEDDDWEEGIGKGREMDLDELAQMLLEDSSVESS